MMLPAVFRWGLRSCHHKWLTNVKAGASSVGSGFPTSKHSAHSPIFATNKAWVASAQVKNNSGLWNKIAAQTKTYHCACGGICCNHSPFETTWNSHRKCLASKASKGEGFSLSRFAGQTPTQWTWHHTIIIIINIIIIIIIIVLLIIISIIIIIIPRTTCMTCKKETFTLQAMRCWQKFNGQPGQQETDRWQKTDDRKHG